MKLIAANALHRRMTAAELKHIVGEQVFRSFYPQGDLYNFDAEDRSELAHLGTTDKGEDIEISKRAAESDLLVYVNVNLVAMDGRHKSVGIGLASYLLPAPPPRRQDDGALAVVHGPQALGDAPLRVADGPDHQGHREVFQIETTLDNDVFRSRSTSSKREWEWSVRDQATMLGVPPGSRGRAAEDAAQDVPRHAVGLRADRRERGRGRGRARADAGEGAPAAPRRGAGAVRRARDGRAVPQALQRELVDEPDPRDLYGSRLLLQLLPGSAVVRKGGAVILYHPSNEGFNQLHHPSYVDFYEEVLAESTDPAVVGEKYEQQFAQDPWYITSRTSHAYHGVHPFYMWYWAAHAMDHVDEVIWVGGDRRVAARLGFRAASTLADALEMASGTVGSSPSITYLHNPPHLLADVR